MYIVSTTSQGKIKLSITLYITRLEKTVNTSTWIKQALVHCSSVNTGKYWSIKKLVRTLQKKWSLLVNYWVKGKIVTGQTWQKAICFNFRYFYFQRRLRHLRCLALRNLCWPGHKGKDLTNLQSYFTLHTDRNVPGTVLYHGLGFNTV